jgi:hypothetical protein
MIFIASPGNKTIIFSTNAAKSFPDPLLCPPHCSPALQVIVEDLVKANPNGLQLMYSRLLEFVPHHCRLLREVTGGAVSRYRCWSTSIPSLWSAAVIRGRAVVVLGPAVIRGGAVVVFSPAAVVCGPAQGKAGGPWEMLKQFR